MNTWRIWENLLRESIEALQTQGGESLEPLIYSQWIRSTGDNLDLQWASKVFGGVGLHGCIHRAADSPRIWAAREGITYLSRASVTPRWAPQWLAGLSFFTT